MAWQTKIAFFWLMSPMASELLTSSSTSSSMLHGQVKVGDLGLGTYFGEGKGTAHSKVILLTALGGDRGVHTPRFYEAFSPLH